MIVSNEYGGRGMVATAAGIERSLVSAQRDSSAKLSAAERSV